MATSQQQGPVAARQGIFGSHPQQYPRALAKASELAGQLHELVKRGPRSVVATVVDASYLATQGYALCTTETAIVQVYGIPFGSVVPQMRVYVRQQGGQATNRPYIYDGPAPTLSSLSQTGSIFYGTLNPSATATVLATTTSSLVTTSSLPSATGYFWSCFFYLPALPTTAAVIFSMWTSSTSSALNLELLPSGFLRLRSINDGHGYITTTTVAPHLLHYVQIQPGLSGNAFLVDGVSNYTGLLSSGDTPTFAGNGANYTLIVLSDPSGNYVCPLGSWISKFGFGASYSGGVVVALPSGIPTSDSALPQLNSGSTMQTTALYLCNDTPGATSAANSAPAGSASAFITLTAASTAVNALGPY